MRYKKPPVLKYLNFSSLKIEQARLNNRLLLIDIHMSNKCNLYCPNCYRNAGEVLADELTLDEYKNILQQAKNLGAKTWIITGSGEPFLDYKLKPLIVFANSLNIGVVIFTNNTLITPKLATWLFDQKVSIVAKMNSFKPKIQDFIVGKKDSSKTIYDGLKNLINAGFNKTNPSRIGIDSVIVRQNYEEIPDIFKFCRDNNIIPYITTELHGGRGKENAEKLDVSNKDIRDMFYLLCDIDKAYGFDWEPHPPVVAGGSCKKVLYQLFVGSTGEIGVCPGLQTSAGNIRNTSLKEVLKSEAVYKIRNPEKFYNPCPICMEKNKNCTGGCLLSKENNNMFGIDQQCCW